MNLIGIDHIQGRPLVDVSPEQFLLGLEARVRTQFAAARHMLRQRSGVMASDRASALTATIANVTCGELLD